MPTLRTAETDTTGLREALAARLRDHVARWRRVVHRLDLGCPWPATLRRLEAGETVEVAGWELPAGFVDRCPRGYPSKADCRRRRCAAVHDYDRFVFGVDGTLSRI